MDAIAVHESLLMSTVKTQHTVMSSRCRGQAAPDEGEGLVRPVLAHVDKPAFIKECTLERKSVFGFFFRFFCF
jgi:hypothetical protein